MPAERIRWTKEEVKLAFYLYCQLPFGRLHSQNPQICQLAERLGRTPSAVAMKLGNIASIDPLIRMSGRKGLGNASRLDREVWEEFHLNWNGTVGYCEDFFHKIPQTTERTANVNVRVGQNFFRTAVLASYGGRCCMSNTSVPALLIASHIVPWAIDEKERLNPSNGLCLSAIHDRAYDQGFLTVLPNMTIRVSPQLQRKSSIAEEPIIQHLCTLDGQKIRTPEKFGPNRDFLDWHSKNIFKE